MTEEKLSRYELGRISSIHDEQHWRAVTPEYVDSQLARIGLNRHASRFEVARRIEEFERRLNR